MSGTLERTKSQYKPEEIERGLHQLALQGNAYKASEATGIPRRTLDEWKNHTHKDRYEQIREEVIPKVHAQIAAECEDLTRGYAALEARGLQSLEQSWDELKPSEQAAALPRIATVKGINADKARVYRDRPSRITEHRGDVDVLLRGLQTQGVLTVEGTAEEVQDAQLQPAPTT